jgi:protein AFG1
MLIDLLADSLPNRKKRRWHFNAFMLETLARLEHLRKTRSDGNSEHSLLWLAKDMIEKSPILFLDEFQLPDRASSKILSNLFTAFFQLGGVLIASSNRMPDELAKASGVHFAVQPRAGFARNWLSLGGGNTLPADNEYAGFVDVLKARCDIIDILSTRDWRRREAEETEIEIGETVETMREEMIEGFSGPEILTPGKLALDHEPSQFNRRAENPIDETTKGQSNTVKAKAPKKYILVSADNEEVWSTVVLSALPYARGTIPWQTTTLSVYGREVPVSRHLAGVSFWTFAELCGETFGPADYITLASTFHTLILDEVPVLTLSQKNEARRLINLLDALYEARCKLVIRAEAGPDDLFFPETKIEARSLGDNEAARSEAEGGDSVYSETISEIYQDQTSPFRPNVASYVDDPKTGYNPAEDSDFGSLPGDGTENGRRVDFGKTNSFTGEDERFAYKRAASRLWEMCGARWHARSEPGWWRPLPLEVRRWERSSSADPATTRSSSSAEGTDVKLGESISLDEFARLQGKLEKEERAASNPFRRSSGPPPKFSWTHAWGMMKWGKKAGPWGQGPEGLSQRKGKTGDR